MLIFVSDLHLLDAPGAPTPPVWPVLRRLLLRAARGGGQGRPITLCIAGDFVDVVRSPTWHGRTVRPYDDAGPAQAAVVGEIVEGVVTRHQPLFAALRRRVEAGSLEVQLLLGNHDRLLGTYPEARRRLARALTGRDDERPIPTELAFRDHGVLAYHGHQVEPYCSEPDGSAPIGDAIGAELIVGLPRRLRQALGDEVAGTMALDELDDVRPIYAVPAWIAAHAAADPDWGRKVSRVWRELVEEFLARDFVDRWFRGHHRRLSLDFAAQLRLALTASAKVGIGRAVDQRLVKANEVLSALLDGKWARAAAEALERPSSRGLRWVVNGHTHFAGMTPLGQVGGGAAAYFNSGTWRRLHQLGGLLGDRPAFLAYDAMTFLVFQRLDDPAGRSFEWWTGARSGYSDPP